MTSRTPGQEPLHRLDTEICFSVTRDEAGPEKLYAPFSVPGGISGHGAPTTTLRSEALACACE